MKHSFSCLIYYSLVFGYQMQHSFSCLIYYFTAGLDIRRKLLLLVCDVYLLGVWISDETPLSRFDMLLLVGYTE